MRATLSPKGASPLKIPRKNFSQKISKRIPHRAKERTELLIHHVIASAAKQSIFIRMILSVTLSKPVNNIEESLGKPYTKIKIRAVNSAGGASYAAEMFTKTQVFHKKFSDSELEIF